MKDAGVGKRAGTATLNVRGSNTSSPNLSANKPGSPAPAKGPRPNAKASNGKTKTPQRVAPLRKINTPDAVGIASDGVDTDNSPQSASKAGPQSGSSLNGGHKPNINATTGKRKSPTTGKSKQGVNTSAHTLVIGSDLAEEGYAHTGNLEIQVKQALKHAANGFNNQLRQRPKAWLGQTHPPPNTKIAPEDVILEV
jgi:hypothetical protein